MTVKSFLDELNDKIEIRDYIYSDPIQFMHAFEDKKDMEIAGFFAAIMAWGRRDIICRKVEDLLERMQFRPARFVENYTPGMAEVFSGFKHRTFKPVDIHGLVSALHQILKDHRDFESFWKMCLDQSLNENRELISVFHERFLSSSNEIASRSYKHISNSEKNSTCKRLYMYLRWCIRKNSPVDTGIWNFLDPKDLMIPLDVHVGRQARRIGLLTRKNSDWKAVNELTDNLCKFDPDDPIRYDYALFGLGVLGYTIPKEFLVTS